PRALLGRGAEADTGTVSARGPMSSPGIPQSCGTTSRGDSSLAIFNLLLILRHALRARLTLPGGSSNAVMALPIQRQRSAQAAHYEIMRFDVRSMRLLCHRELRSDGASTRPV